MTPAREMLENKKRELLKLMQYEVNERVELYMRHHPGADRETVTKQIQIKCKQLLIYRLNEEKKVIMCKLEEEKSTKAAVKVEPVEVNHATVHHKMMQTWGTADTDNLEVKLPNPIEAEKKEEPPEVPFEIDGDEAVPNYMNKLYNSFMVRSYQ